MYINKFVPVYTLLILIYSFNASAEWTGDKTNAYYSDEVISELHVGQIDTSPYFCIKTVKLTVVVHQLLHVRYQSRAYGHPPLKNFLTRQDIFIVQGNP